MNPCPAVEQLQRLLDDRLSQQEASDLKGHVDDCKVCDDRLRQLANDPTEQRWRQLAGGPIREAPRVEWLRETTRKGRALLSARPSEPALSRGRLAATSAEEPPTHEQLPGWKRGQDWKRGWKRGQDSFPVPDKKSPDPFS
ncbi:hypothetical protein OAS39_11865 [Pirellulales bacterium]|nr:hypothetical protein [Pirellulales bacterium]